LVDKKPAQEAQGGKKSEESEETLESQSPTHLPKVSIVFGSEESNFLCPEKFPHAYHGAVCGFIGDHRWLDFFYCVEPSDVAEVFSKRESLLDFVRDVSVGHKGQESRCSFSELVREFAFEGGLECYEDFGDTDASDIDFPSISFITDGDNFDEALISFMAIVTEGLQESEFFHWVEYFPNGRIVFRNFSIGSKSFLNAFDS
jgi:hypothetical protein